MDSNENKSLFIINSFSKKDIILFLLPFNYVLSHQFADKDNNFALKYFSKFFGFILGGIIIFIIYKLRNLGYNQVGKKINFFKLEYKILIIIFIISFLNVLSSYIINLSSKFKKYETYFPFIFPIMTIFLWIFSKLILKLELFKHHYFSIIIISIGLIIINLINGNINIHINKNDILLIIYLLLLQYIFTLIDILIYYLLYENEIELYLLLSIIGIIGIFLGLIYFTLNNFQMIKVLKKKIYLMENSLIKGIEYIFFIHLSNYLNHGFLA